jgi:anti-sigma factor RsiW
MNCERCQHELEDFLYGELSEGLAGEMRTHLADCAGCAAARVELEREHELFARFYEQTAMDPTSEMWDAIRVRIAAEAPRQVTAEAKPRWWQSLASGWLTPAVLRQAALALLLIALSVAATVVLMKRGDGDKNVAQNNPSTTPTPQNSTPAPIPSPTTNVATAEPPVELAAANQTPARPTEAPRAPVKAQPLSDQELLARQLTRAEREYQSAIKMLDRAIAKRRDEIAPEALKQYQASLALIDSSIAQSKRALQERPDDPSASQFLLAAYAKKVELMQTIAMD